MKELKLSDVHDKVDALVVKLRADQMRALPSGVALGDVLRLAELLQVTLRASQEVLQEMVKIQTLHQTSLEDHLGRLEKLEHPSFEVKPLRPFGGTHDA